MIDLEQYNRNRKVLVETLRQFKTTPGYQALLELVNNEQAACVAQFMYGEFTNWQESCKVQAKAQAWTNVISLIDQEIDKHDQFIEATKKRAEAQMQSAQDMLSYREQQALKTRG